MTGPVGEGSAGHQGVTADSNSDHTYAFPRRFSAFDFSRRPLEMDAYNVAQTAF